MDLEKMTTQEQIDYCDLMISEWAALKYQLTTQSQALTKEEQDAIKLKVSVKKSDIASNTETLSKNVAKEKAAAAK